MAIVENRSTEIGDVLRIETNIPIVGIVSLFSFIDDVEGETVDRQFDKKFRYSVDGGLNFSELLDLTSINLQNIEVSRKDYFIIEYRYERIGSDVTGELAWNSTTLDSTIEPLEYPVYNTTIFKRFFDVNNPNVLGWALNVLEKLYQKGILPDYVIRGEDELNPTEADGDFTAFFFTCTHFFAIIVYYARQFRDITSNSVLLREFTLNRGVTPPYEENQEQLLYLFENYPQEYRNRGTEKIAVEASDVYTPHGELLRLINYVTSDEFIFGLVENKLIGWCVGNSSPTWRSCKNAQNLIKAYEPEKEVIDLANYPLLNSSEISIVDDGGINVMQISGYTNATGIGIADPVTPDQNFLIKVSEFEDYEISFKIKKTESLPIVLKFGVHVYNSLFVLLQTQELENGATESSFLTADVNLNVQDVYYSFRATLFNKDEPLRSDRPIFQNGQFLRMTEGVNYVQPFVTVEGGGNSVVNIYDFKVLPISFNFTQGQLGQKNVIFSILDNNGGASDSGVISFIQDFLVPYNSYFKAKFISDE